MRTRQKWIISVALLLFAMLFGWYFLVYVDNRKEMLQEHGYRTLGQLAQNLNAKINSYQNSINYYHNASLPVERLKIKVDSLQGRVKRQENSGKNYSYIDDDHNQLVLREYAKGSDSVRRYSIPVSILMNNLINRQFFNDIFILSHYPETEKDVNKKDKIIYQTSVPPLFIENGDSLFTNSNGFFRSEINTIDLAGKDYKVFYFPATLGSLHDDSKIILAGLIDQKVFNRKAYQVGTWIIILLSIFVLLIIVSLPLIKLMLMNEVERIYLSNVVLAITGVMLGSVTIILLILNLSNYYRSSKMVKDNLEHISDKVVMNFNQELDSIITLLNRSDNLLATIKNIKNDVDLIMRNKVDISIFNGTRTISVNDVLNSANLDRFDLNAYQFLDELFWVDKEGLQKYQLSIYPDSKAGFVLRNRDYFSKIKDGTYWQQTNDKAFYLQSILSWSSGTNQAAISIPVKPGSPAAEDLAVVAVTTNLHSLIEVVMPMGYGFCLFDEQGRVLFHNQREKNLQQDLFNELKNYAKVQTVISSRKSDFFTSKYEDRDHQFYVRSIHQLPLYLATFYNLESDKEKLNVVNFLTISAFILGTLFFWLLVTITSVLNRRKSKINDKLIHLNCLTPSANNYWVYRRLFQFYALLALLLFLLMFFSDNFLQNGFIDKIYGYFMLISLSYLLNSLLVKEDHQPMKNQGVLTWINLGIFFLLAVQVENILYPLTLGLVFLSAFIVLSLKKPAKKFVTNYHSAYRLYLFSWLVILTVVPVCILFFSTFNYEERIWSMHKQIHYAQQKLQHDRFVDNYYQGLRGIDAIPEERKKMGLYYSLYDSEETIDDAHFSKLNNLVSDTLSIRRYLSIRPAFQPAVIENQNLLAHLVEELNESSDLTLQWKFCSDPHTNLANHSSILHFRYKDYSTPPDANPVFTSAIPYFDVFYAWRQGMNREIAIILLLAVLALAFIYQEIKFAVGKIFSFDFPFVSSKENQRIRNEMKKPFHKIMIISLPYSGLNKFLEPEYESIDLLAISDEDDYKQLLKKLDTQKRTNIWIKHFEYQYENLDSNRCKLAVIEKCTRLKKSSIIISSTIYPQQIIEFYDNLLEHEKDDQKILQLKNDRDRWSYLLYDFKKYNYSFVEQPYYQETSLEIFIHNECSHGNFLKSLEAQIMDMYRDKLHLRKTRKEYEDTREDIITHLKNIANHYYSNLWYSCSREERYLLYDLASDGFINSTNKEAILNLIEKGLLKYQEQIRDLDNNVVGYNDRLSIMNESFRYFILTSIKHKEVEKMEREQEKLSNWGSIRTLLIIIVIGLTIFITFAQQNVLSSIQTIVAALGSVLLVFTQLGNIFSFRFKGGKTGRSAGSNS